MTKRHATVPLAGCMALWIAFASAGAVAQEYDANIINFYDIPEPAPRTLFGLWALDGKCPVRSARLRVTATTLAVAGRPPVGYEYIPEDPHHLEATLAPKDMSHSYTYYETDRTLDLDTTNPERDRSYRPCFGHTGLKADPNGTFETLVTRLIHDPLSDAQTDALSRVYFIKGEAAFRVLARLLAAGRRTDLRARLQRFEQEMAVYPGLEHAGAAGLARPKPTPDFGPDRAGR